MIDLILPYLFGTIATAIVLFLSTFNYVRGKRERQTYERERALLPDAVRLERLQDLRKRAEEDYDSIQQQLADAKLVVSEREDAAHWLETNRDKLLQLKADREEQEVVRKQLETLQNKVADENELLNQSHMALASVKAELDYFSRFKEEKQKELDQYEASKQKLLQERLQLQSELEPLQVRLAGIQSNIDLKHEEFERVAGTLQNRVNQYEQQLLQNKDLLEQSEAKLSSIRGEIEKITLETFSFREERSRVSADLQALQREKSNLEQLLKDLENERNELIAKRIQLQADLEPLQVKLAGIESSIKSKIEESQQLAESLKHRISQYEQQLLENKELLQQSETRLKETTALIDKATQELFSIRDERSRLSADVQALQREKVALEDLIKNLRADWNTVLRMTGQDEGADERRTQELWVPYIAKKAKEFNEIQSPSELELLAQTESYLRGKRLYFPRRVLWAFHASLKVTDISPLVVLAGISGTGKSELPRRYAEAMGLHFLNVAVQPRWDSPQDMFGFFNYLENRYRATELGRALVQMDPFHQDEGRGWSKPKDWEHSLSSQVMLVLLDEMNLARVEYYFSEFLSRLETRRGVNKKDPQSRRKAEIGLEVGSGKSSSPIMQLFVDRNVLFVGTMNEDETTQALSDKVIDRANVLRFGRPGNIKQDYVSEASIDLERRLNHSDWASWCKSPEDLPPDIMKTVTEYVDRLDDAMSQIKRPFGFRTRNGIMSYVANYPSKDADAVDDAISDQIEQKILPKFRGLDPREHEVKAAITKVRKVLSELRDELLVDALDQTAKESQFVWQGVNRFSEELN